LSRISQAYQVSVDTLLNLNGLNIDRPLQIGQELLVSPGLELAGIERLTPDSDGQYFHTIQSGETLSGIAGLYEISLGDLMAWNGLGVNSIIRPGQNLLLLVTPPATRTPTPGPPTATAVVARSVTPTPPQPTQTQTRTPVVYSPTAPAGSASRPANLIEGWPLPIALIASGLLILVWMSRRRP
jgi:LysM repeat protein